MWSGGGGHDSGWVGVGAGELGGEGGDGRGEGVRGLLARLSTQWKHAQAVHLLWRNAGASSSPHQKETAYLLDRPDIQPASMLLPLQESLLLLLGVWGQGGEVLWHLCWLKFNGWMHVGPPYMS
jgi:hypothetical protein